MAKNDENNILPSTGHKNNTAQPKSDILAPHQIFHRLTVVQVSFCSLIKRITLKIRVLCFLLINSVLFNILCVWVLLCSSCTQQLGGTCRQVQVCNKCVISENKIRSLTHVSSLQIRCTRVTNLSSLQTGLGQWHGRHLFRYV